MINSFLVAFKRINFKFIYFIFLIKLNLFYKTSITSVSKCHYEGDFTVNCKESNELMRTANVINGLHYNDTQCFYNPKESHCHRQTALSYCVDKPSCAIKNDWFSLAPQCDGNSYYSQFNFDCQPAYYMCEDTVVKDAFSGLIYSPMYPSSFRTESSTPCFLTINLPKDHHVEITLDHFDIFKYQNCLADFLEIQEYKEDVSGLFSNKNLLKQRRSFNYNNITSKLRLQVKLPKKTMTSTRQKVYKWSTVALMCGKEDSKLIMKASSDIINFKFKSISSQHNYLKLINNTRVYSGFKIYFQAIPPVNDDKNMQATVQTVTKDQSSKSVQKITQENDLAEKLKEPVDEQQDNKFKTESGSKSSLWIIVTSILLAVLALITVLIAVVICSLKRRGLLNQQSVSFLKSSKQAKNGLQKTSVSPATVLSASKKKKTNKKLAVEDSENSAKFSTTTKSDTPTPHAYPSPGENNKAKPVNATSKYVPQTNQVRTVLEAEPRKMQAERPALLQDLGKSKLLLKYKQSVGDSVEQKLVKQEIVKPTESAAGKSVSPEKTSLSLKLPVMNSVNTDDMESGVYTGGSKEDSKLISDYSINGSDLVNLKSNPITVEKPKLTTVEEKSVESPKTSPIQTTTITTNLNETKINDEINSNKSNETIKSDRASSLKMKRIFLAKNTVVSNDQDEMNELPQPKLEIVEELDKEKQESEAFSTDNSISFTQQDSIVSDSNLETSNFIQPQSNQPRRSAFNPLHVILKDRNKYYTTEYI